MAIKRAVRFTNFSDEDFVGIWDKEEFLIPAGESIMLQEYLALHFAKHLIDRELNKENKPTNLIQHRNPMMEKCIGKVFVEADSQLKLEQKMLNSNEPVKTKSEEKLETIQKDSEEEFAGLKEKGDIARQKPENNPDLAKNDNEVEPTSEPESAPEPNPVTENNVSDNNQDNVASQS